MDGGRAAAERWASVERLLDRALDLAPAERAAFVAREAAHDPTLRAEVEALLARCHEMLTFLDEPAAEFAAPLLAASLADPAAPVRRRRAAPARVGPYRVLRELGRGGMGVVYLAERDDAPPPHPQVALKVLPAEAGVATAVRRFHAERRILASLDHPNVARLLDGGVAPDGTPWFSMELVDGLPIDRWCDERGLDVDARLRLFLDVCAVVRYAHERRIVHRDLKPSNILVRDDGSPTLLDFGIAKLLDGGDADGDASAEGRLTRTGVRVLTPGYASPEQVRGEPVSPASDVYALGVLLHELLAGHGPYGDDRPDARELQRRVLEHEPARPSSLVADPRRRRRLRGDLDAIVLTALRKDPARRYGSVEDLADDVRRHLAGKRVAARRRTTRNGALRYDSRMRTSILVWSAVGGAVVGLIVAALLVGAGVLLHLVLPAAPARLLARTAPLTIPLVVALLALAGAVLGYLEGRLKL